MADSKLAVIFDFDDTLVPDTTTQLLQKYKINPENFWSKEVKALIDTGYDPTLAYLNKFLENVGKDKPFGKLTNEDLHNFGKTLDDKFFSGLPQIFDDLKEIVKNYKDIDIEFYIISGGLQEIIKGSKIVQDNFTSVYGCELDEDSEFGHLKYIKRAISFTEKTRYIFEINKGITPDEVNIKPFLVNKDIPITSRRIPIENMIYVGDGLTDIPCFSLIMKGNGIAFGVLDPSKTKSAKQALQEYIITHRVVSVHAPNYLEDVELGSLIRATVTSRCTTISLRRREAE
jgi:2-hydroxy-3-keto-5-methylthiopentenyl-1-phosphate phosphatase